ncbi:putative dipeptide ABC transport system periplasmic binding component [Klebsiella pneumoniae]|uniref:Putative dipeptide ABC transport system periplasmic binding component n=1 Tax=Klebsiella pneumoniae TaxID=573 RepID=A0A377VA77_KLEPN|nr:putative dipeptide ABC transport system periplasmic binding component [Klebsiella pneumoniae]
MEPHPHSSLRALVYNPDNSDKARLTNFQGCVPVFTTRN